MSNEFDTWLEEEDIQRLWDVAHGLIPELSATTAELEEFQRLVTHCAMIKMGGEDYQQATLQ